jgi:hypothetical protein
MNLQQLVKNSGYKVKFVGEKLGLAPYQISRLLRSTPSEAQTTMLSAVLVSQLGVCDRRTLMAAISATKEQAEERKMKLWNELMRQVEEDRKKEHKAQGASKPTKSKAGKGSNGNGVRRRVSKK